MTQLSDKATEFVARQATNEDLGQMLLVAMERQDERRFRILWIEAMKRLEADKQA